MLQIDLRDRQPGSRRRETGGLAGPECIGNSVRVLRLRSGASCRIVLVGLAGTNATRCVAKAHSADSEDPAIMSNNSSPSWRRSSGASNWSTIRWSSLDPTQCCRYGLLPADVCEGDNRVGHASHGKRSNEARRANERRAASASLSGAGRLWPVVTLSRVAIHQTATHRED